MCSDGDTYVDMPEEETGLQFHSAELMEADKYIQRKTSSSFIQCPLCAFCACVGLGGRGAFALCSSIHLHSPVVVEYLLQLCLVDPLHFLSRRPNLPSDQDQPIM